MPKTTTRRTPKTPPLKKRGEKIPHELKAKLKMLETMLAAAEKAGMISGQKMVETMLAAAEKAGMISGQKMARIQCPGCGTLDLGVAWSKKTGWAVLCDTCCSMSPLSAINPPDPEDHEVGERQVVPVVRVKGSGSVN